MDRTALPQPSTPRLERARAVLGEVFGLRAFRPWQWDAIVALLEGKGRVLLVAPTGGGKSLTYQLPATVLDGVTLVLSPLVALMEDQVRSLEARGIAATFLSATLDQDERRRREEAFSRGAYKLVFVAPERLASGSFLARLARAKVDLVAIDEAHCIAQWGHDFRPDYLRIGELLRMLDPPRILACTATATPLVRKEIVERLGLAEGMGFEEVLRGFARPNLHLRARTVDGPREAKELVFSELARTLGSPKNPKGAAIVYAATRKSTEKWTELLVEKGYSCATYHAGLEGETRAKVSAAFSSGRLDVVVATNAFGMGIDRPDIRAVIHAQPPQSVEAYYQEVGRAGRDGDEAHGLLLCSAADIAVRRRFAAIDSEGNAADPEVTKRAWSQFRSVLTYLDAGSCRHDFILRHFGDERETLGGCGHCDVCERLDEDADAGVSRARDAEEAAIVVRKALSGVARAKQRAGLLAIVGMLVGKDDARVQRFGFADLSTFGILRGESEAWVLAVLRSLLAAGLIDLTPTEHPVPLMTREGWAVLKSPEPVRVLLPSREDVLRKTRATSTRARDPVSGDALRPEERAVFEVLRALRAELAKERRVPAYVVARDQSLVEVAKKKPKSLAELGTIGGFGPSRLDAYGDAFLKALGTLE
jgi:ATP-dependent DNA helicase RecQ